MIKMLLYAVSVLLLVTAIWQFILAIKKEDVLPLFKIVGHSFIVLLCSVLVTAIIIGVF